MLVGEKLMDEREEAEERLPALPPWSPHNYEVFEGATTNIGFRVSQYPWKCMYCGHELSEVRTQRT
jgi:hypothetical protein